MQWISENWLLIALFGVMAAMHLFGHGHGGHGGHEGHGKGPRRAARRNHDVDDGPDGPGLA